MIPRPPPRFAPRRIPAPAVVLGAALALATAAAVAFAGPSAAADGEPALPTLEPMQAAGMPVDTLLIGGFARGTFVDALRTLASDLSDAEREMVGRHLDRIFQPILDGEGLRRGGRLRVAYERSLRHDGTTRAIQVLAAQAAVAGGLHTVFLFEHGDNPGYYDDLGRSLDPRAWTAPLNVLRVTSPYRTDRMHPILNRVLPHLGVDYAAPTGTPVYATADGSVSFAGKRGGYGNLVELQHPNGFSTRYAHLSRIAVRPWEPVRQGEVIGYVGMTGLATGPHLHYEVRRKGRPVDPALASQLASPLEDVGYDMAWRHQRAALGALLAHTPTEVVAAQ